MLYVRTSIGVEIERADDLLNVLVTTFDAEIIGKSLYNETYPKDFTSKVYIECAVRKGCYDLILDYLDNKFTGKTIMEG